MAQIIEAGTYRARALEGALGETSSGKEQVAVRFALLDLPQQTITWYGYFTDKTLESTFRALRTAGWRGQELSDLSDLSREDAPEVHLVVEHETDDKGTTRARVRWVNGTGGVGLKSQLPPDKAKAFSARMKGALAAFDRSNGRPAGQQAVAARPSQTNGRPVPASASEVPQEVLDRQESIGDGDEDIPF